jgi:sugar phosphate isomerase/epimerase
MLGCQTISWGEDQSGRFPEVFAEIAGAGFAGVEIGWRRLANTPPARLRAMLSEHGLVLAASHVGGNLADTAQARGEWEMLDRVLDYLNETGTPRLMFSGLSGVTERGRLDAELAVLQRAAERCRARGVQLLYHNHDWEFRNDAMILTALLAAGTIEFCPDVGWITKAGANVAEVLARMSGRVGAMHFKDFADMTPGINTVVLGTGVAALSEAAAWVRANVRGEFWVIAEQDRTDRSTADMAAANLACMKSLLRTDAG